MTLLRRVSALAVLLAAGLAAPCRADSISTSASSASSAGSASVGMLSDSLRGSSDSSRSDRVAAGDYRIVEIAAVDGRPGLARLRLAPLDAATPGSEWWLDVPAVTLAARALAVGDVIAARPRPYGVEFARADTREPFFLVLADDWYRELAPRAVTL